MAVFGRRATGLNRIGIIIVNFNFIVVLYDFFDHCMYHQVRAFPFTAQAFSGRLLSQKRKGKRKKRRKRSDSGREKVGNWWESGQGGGVLTFLLR